MNLPEQRLAALRARIKSACDSCSREASQVALVAVSKLHPPEAILALHRLGQVRFGENRLQEAVAKQDAIGDSGIEWHFIGPVQSNKTRDIATRFDWVQSVDRPKILQRLSEQRPPGHGPLNICLQVNIDTEPQKAGLAPADVAAMAERATLMDNIHLRGLMCIPRLSDEPADTADSFARMRDLFESLRAAGHDLDTLSMGMSADLEVAIASGSTMVRVGTDLFGPRPAQPPGHGQAVRRQDGELA